MSNSKKGRNACPDNPFEKIKALSCHKKSYLCRKKTSMKDKQKTILNWTLNILFCVGLVFFFGNFCILRPADCQHIHKEYLTGFFVLFIIYINKFALFPNFYVKAKYWKYVLFTFATTLVAFVFEMLLVAPDIAYSTSEQFPLRSTIAYLTMDGFFVLLRDLSFAAITFSVQAFLYYKNLNKSKDYVMLAEFQRIEAGTLGKSSKRILIPLDDISFCKQDRNYTRIFLSDGQCCIRYGTFKDFTGLLNESYAAQVNRGTVVPYSNVVSYNSSGVVVKSIPENTIISFSDHHAAHAYELMSTHVQKPKKEISLANVPKKHGSNPRTIHKKKQQQSEILYAYISEHPGCSASEIKKNRSLSQSTVNRILAQLKAEGLIEYVGSKKTGGYRVTGD